nr:hypothetical protein BaRGS_023434 [Batillaria attramentaria]
MSVCVCIGFFVTILFYVCLEVAKIGQDGLAAWLRSPWTWIELASIILSLTLLTLHLVRLQATAYFRKNWVFALPLGLDYFRVFGYDNYLGGFLYFCFVFVLAKADETGEAKAGDKKKGDKEKGDSGKSETDTSTDQSKGENFNVVIFSKSTNSRGTKLGMLID